MAGSRSGAGSSWSAPHQLVHAGRIAPTTVRRCDYGERRRRADVPVNLRAAGLMTNRGRREQPRPPTAQTRHPPPPHPLPPPTHRRPHRIPHKAHPPSRYHRHQRRHRRHHQGHTRGHPPRPPRGNPPPPLRPRPLTPPAEQANSADQHKHRPDLYTLELPTTHPAPLSTHHTVPAHTPRPPRSDRTANSVSQRTNNTPSQPPPNTPTSPLRASTTASSSRSSDQVGGESSAPGRPSFPHRPAGRHGSMSSAPTGPAPAPRSSSPCRGFRRGARRAAR